MSPATVTAITARCPADEKLIVRALERIRDRERKLLRDAEEPARLHDEHARLSMDFETHRRACPTPGCGQCFDTDRAADAAFNAYVRLREQIMTA